MANSSNTTLGENNFAALKMLKEVTKVFENEKIKYVLDCGTLLGVYRENRLLPWDNDVDLSFFCDDEKKIKFLVKQIRRAGYYVKIKYQEKNDYPLKKGKIRLLKVFNKNIFYRNRVLLDCFLMKKLGEENFVCAYGGINHYTKINIPYKYFDKVGYLKFEGKTFSIPNLIEDYLTHRYGDWRIPIDDGSYDYRKDDHSIVFSQILETNTVKSNGEN